MEPQSEVVIVIERKDGASLAHNQLTDYRNWTEKKFRGYRQLFVLSDSWQQNHPQSAIDNWIQLDDSWLVDALKEALIPGRLPVSVHERLEDLLYHFDTEGEYRDPFHRGIENELRAFALEHRGVIQQLKANDFSRVNARSALSEWISVADHSPSDCVKQAFVLASRYSTLLQSLMAVQSLEVIKDELDSICADLDLVFELYTDRMLIGTRAMQALCDESVVECWPVTLKLFLPKKRDENRQTELQDNPAEQTSTIEILMDMRAFGKDRYEDAKEIANTYELQARQRWASQTTYITHDDLIRDKWAMLIGKVKMMVDISYDWKPEQP